MESKTISTRRQNANRANAQKSTGPRTAEGKAISARNALQHGLTASTFIIETENLDEFNQFREAYYTRFGPRDQVENDLVDKIVHAIWNEKRVWAMEHEAINVQMARMSPDIAKTFKDLPPIARAALAFGELSGTPSLPLLHRYAARLSSEFHKSMKTLRELQQNVPLLPPGADLPEPIQPDDETNPCPKTDTTRSSPTTTRQPLTITHHPLPTATDPVSQTTTPDPLPTNH